MNTSHTIARHVPLLYGELNEQDAREVRDHLAECDGCSRDFAALAMARSAYDASTPSPDLERQTSELFATLTALQAAQQAPTPTRRPFFRRMWLALPIAAAAACIALVLLLSGVKQTAVPTGTPPASVAVTTPPATEAPISIATPAGTARPLQARARSRARNVETHRPGMAAQAGDDARATETATSTPVSLEPRFSQSVLDAEIHSMRRRVNSLVRYVNNDEF